MSFFGSMLQGGGMGTNPAGAQSFTSPPIDPQILALLSALSKQQDMGQQQQPQFQAPQPVQPGQQAPGAGPQQPNGLQSAIDQIKNLDPQTLKAIFARLAQQRMQGQQPQPQMPAQMP